MKKHFAALAALAFVLSLTPPAVEASDHADPIKLSKLDSGITGLFVWREGDRMIVILTIYRGLRAAGPYDLEGFEYAIHMDVDTPVTFATGCADLPARNQSDAQKKKAKACSELDRYGGSINQPERIQEQIKIKFRMDDYTNLKEGYPQYPKAWGDARDVEVFVGVRDDPFIFPRFFDRNIIAMALSIPLSRFDAGQQDFLIWATSSKVKNGKQIDHVGRSNRTQLGRFDFLNTIHPSEQVAAIDRRLRAGNYLQRFLMHAMGHFSPVGAISGLFEYVLQIRPYDPFADVMIFTLREDEHIKRGYPNGRRLPDDVAALTCAVGDCVLQEVSYIEGGWPRATTNDVPFEAEFPYLGLKHSPKEMPREWVDRCFLYFLLVLLGILGIFILKWQTDASAAEKPYVRPPVRH